MKPNISVLMTTYNAEKFLKFSLKSIVKQSFSNWELIIIDDCSKDNSLKIINSFKNKKIKVYKLRKHLGRTKALNYGLDKCKGKYVAILDADDFSNKHRLKKQFNHLEKNKKTKMTCSWFTRIYPNKFIKELSKPKIRYNFFRKHLLENIIAHSSVMFYRLKALELGKYPNKLKYAQDWGLILKFFRHSKVDILPLSLVDCTVDDNSMTFTSKYKKTVVKDYIENLKYVKKNFNLNILELIIYIFILTKKKIKLLLM